MFLWSQLLILLKKFKAHETGANLMWKLEEIQPRFDQTDSVDRRAKEAIQNLSSQSSR